MDDIEKTIPPERRCVADSNMDEMTMPGKRDRKPDGRFAVGDLIMNRYKVLAELGQGGMGVVYKCFDEDAGIEVALKALPPELSHNTLEMEDIKENFQLVHNLHHPNIASSNNLEKDKSNGNYYLIMECCEGEDLRRWLKRKRKDGELKLEDVLPIIQQVASALDYAHEMKIMHRDIKPGNIMINNLGKIKVLDFGLAAQIHTSMTRVSMAYHGTSGTGPYMAPEQWEGRIQDAKADQYALAVMTYEMLAGHTPFESTDAAVLREAVLKSKVIPLENIPSSANAAVMRALSKDPAERFENCSDFAAALGGKKIKATKIVKKSSSGKWIAAIILLALLGGGGTGYYLFDKQQKEDQRIAAEKEKERLEKLAEEKAEKELDRENSELKVELTGKIAEIDRKGYDPAQTFGEKIREMKNAFAAAQEAKLLSTANREYKKVQKLADWILTNGEVREEAENLKHQAENNKNAADKYESQTYAAKLYSSAGTAYAQALKLYNELNFSEAKKRFAESVKAFKNAENTAFDNKLQFLQDKAKDCEKNSQWNELKVWAEKIRPLNSTLANQFIAQADNELKKLAAEKVEKERQAKIAAEKAEKERLTIIKDLSIQDSAIQALHNEKYLQALKLFEKMSTPTGKSLYFMGICYEKLNDVDSAKKFMLSASQKNYFEATLWLAKREEKQKNFRAALEHYQSAIKQKDKKSLLSAAIIYLSKDNVCYDEIKGIEYMKQAAEAGIPNAQFNLGCMYAKIQGFCYDSLPYNKNNAEKWLNEALKNNIFPAREVLKILR